MSPINTALMLFEDTKPAISLIPVPEFPKSNLYEYPLQPDLSTPITIESMPSGASDIIFLIWSVALDVIDKTWEMLPLPMRLVGKDALNYEDNMFFLRKSIFGKDKEKPEVDSKDESIISKTIRKMFS